MMKPIELSTGAAARLAECDPRTLRKLAEQGRVRCRLTATGRRLFLIEDLQALVAPGR